MYVKKGRYTVEKAIVQCMVCGVSLERYKSALARQKTDRVFCSKACQVQVPAKPRRGMDKTCTICGKTFYVSQFFKDKRTCSVPCNNIAQTKPKVYRTCERCGKEMALKPSQAGRKYCTKRCSELGFTKRYADFDYNGRPAIIDHFGYVWVWQPDHPKAAHGRVRHHRLVFEQALGRYLTRDEQVDHINRIKTDNRLENLQLMTASEHGFKTNGDRASDIQEAKDVMAELQEYRKRFGPIAIESGAQPLQ